MAAFAPRNITVFELDTPEAHLSDGLLVTLLPAEGEGQLVRGWCTHDVSGLRHGGPVRTRTFIAATPFLSVGVSRADNVLLTARVSWELKHDSIPRSLEFSVHVQGYRLEPDKGDLPDETPTPFPGAAFSTTFSLALKDGFSDQAAAQYAEDNLFAEVNLHGPRCVVRYGAGQNHMTVWDWRRGMLLIDCGTGEDVHIYPVSDSRYLSINATGKDEDGPPQNFITLHYCPEVETASHKKGGSMAFSLEEEGELWSLEVVVGERVAAITTWLKDCLSGNMKRFKADVRCDELAESLNASQDLELAPCGRLLLLAPTAWTGLVGWRETQDEMTGLVMAHVHELRTVTACLRCRWSDESVVPEGEQAEEQAEEQEQQEIREVPAIRDGRATVDLILDNGAFDRHRAKLDAVHLHPLGARKPPATAAAPKHAPLTCPDGMRIKSVVHEHRPWEPTRWKPYPEMDPLFLSVREIGQSGAHSVHAVLDIPGSWVEDMRYFLLSSREQLVLCLMGRIIIFSF